TERRIEQRIAALPYATSETSVDLAMSTEAAKLLQLNSAAVFRRADRDEPFRRVAGEGWPGESILEIDRDSLLVRTLLAQERSFFLADLAIDHQGLPHDGSRPILAVPIASQHELLGFGLYGAERDGASPDPQKVELLDRLAQAASSAYSMVEARRWRARVGELERQPLRA
ncbi:MAG: GAF domain-containing protein, partial [Candidatus Eremiobacteraeota bacterium]|nr:GAF domain-containing protein [Candidatus Eremiobacteraeota bacterium]